jgi:UPF0755 protein
LPRPLIIKVAIGFLVGVAVSVFIFVQYISSSTKQPLQIDSTSLFEIRGGESARSVLKHLMDVSKQPISDITGKIWLKYVFSQDTIKRGVYELNPETSLTDAFEMFVNGDQKQFSVTLIEGQTFAQWLEHLRSHEYLVDDWNEDKSKALLKSISADFGLDVTSLEGMLLANTFSYTAQSSISEILKRAYVELNQHLIEHFEIHGLPSNLANKYQILTLASIVEKETAVGAERPLIAGVFLNRLERNMRLQTDPTVIYGLGSDYQGDITREHLRRPTPFNTYVIKGLPPTPIAMVGKEAIDAVFYSELTDYLYFVAKGDGTHFFSKSLESHNKAVRKYQLGQD